MGPYKEITLPPADPAQKAIHTARHTRRLHRTPRKKAVPMGKLALAAAVAMAAGAMLSKTPHRTTTNAITMLPMRFPQYTTAQLPMVLPPVMSPRSSGRRKRQLPVNSSLPAKITMARPAGKIAAEAIFPARAPPTDAAVPARAMNIPARIPKISSRGTLCLVLFFAAAQ